MSERFKGRLFLYKFSLSLYLQRSFRRLKISTDVIIPMKRRHFDTHNEEIRYSLRVKKRKKKHPREESLPSRQKTKVKKRNDYVSIF